MIEEIKFKNCFSFKDEAIFSFEADNKIKDMEDSHVVEIAPGVRLLKLAVIYGANASGKSNFINICNFIKYIILNTPQKKDEYTGIIPFIMDKESISQPSEMSISFYIKDKDDKAKKYVYSLTLNREHIINEVLSYYPSQQPSTIFKRELKDGVSIIDFGTKFKIDNSAKKEISLKCLPNMSVFAAYMQVNININEFESVLNYFKNKIVPEISPKTLINKYTEKLINDADTKSYVLDFLQRADFNISDISSKSSNALDSNINDLIFSHNIKNKEGVNEKFICPMLLESRGTIRAMGFSAHMHEAIVKKAFLTIDEIEISLHPKLIEYIIERFLKDSNEAQILFTTHYDGLLALDDLLRKDNIWFTEKDEKGGSALFPLTDFKGLNRISCLQKAYKYGKFGAIPKI